ncbi:MAG: alginate export family protein [Flavicella sp.]
MKLKKLAIVILILATTQMKAQFSLSGEFIPRTEYRNGFSTTILEDTEPGIATSVRAALKATYKSEGYTTHLNILEVFTMGDRQQLSTAGNGNLRVQEAWADLKLGTSSSLKIGRQGIAYDDQRIMGTVGWAQQMRTHDAAVFKYAKKEISVDLGVAYNQNGVSISGNDYLNTKMFSYKTMQYIHANKKSENANLSALILNTEFQDASSGDDTVTSLLTAGLHADYKLNKLKLSANAFIQDGDRSSESTPYLASLDAAYKATNKTTYGLGAEIISGKSTETSYGFFPVYGTNHKFNGFMDRFYVGNYAKGNGLIDLHTSVATKLGKGYNLMVKALHFMEETESENIGSEIDLVLAKAFNGYTVKVGYSQFFESNDIPEAKSTQNWAWAMLIIKPKFL